jgi:3-oxoacyl-[acyl-carrier protein] reductase
MLKLAGKISVVTGAAQGIGREIALLFAREGADVAIVDRNKKSGEDVAKQIRSLGRRSMSIGADLGEEDQIEEGFRNICRELGPVDILVNNAGIDTTSLVVDMPTSLWDEMFRINLRSVFLCTRAVLPAMIEKRSGRIINLASQLAYKGAREMAHYAAAKAGVIGFTRSLAYEVAEHGITVNSIAPGPIDTELFRNLPEEWRKRKLAELPIGRAGRVEEIAPTALLLASEEGAYYLGATLNPNGGDVMV